MNNDIAVRIYKAIQYIEENSNAKLLLEDVASKAHFSPFHFHRIFKAITGETFNHFIVRKRIEKSADYLLHKPDKSISEIAFSSGFSSISTFSRTFKKFYGMSPKQFQESSSSRFSKICKTESKNGKIETQLEQYICNMNEHLQFIDRNAKKIDTVFINDIDVAYVPHIGPFENLGTAFQKLLQWAYPRNLMNGKHQIMSIYHDSPKITEPDKLKVSACISLNGINIDTTDINTRTISSGKYIEANFELGMDELPNMWEGIFVWIFNKGYKINSELDPFDIYHNDFNTHPQKKCNTTIYIPVL
ncbi:AraC family transcriptional regulator [Tenacibaculum jejuense]|uniref:Transcriptional regulator, AraC family n=1 Tax=Tenacibaculum jejuense TaxID=584609 RepID=A0A238UEJ8_9FLAO|nr:AraC family transcriptional regulator [Tenacibaculum jejuense]SNR17008.1 Transcriptional regulator, AraC family [Tenacibaculum jejuense]